MSFETPAALAFLAAIPLVLLLWRRRSAEVLRVASVLPFRAPPGAPAESARRRGSDPVLVLTLAAITALALAAAGPVGRAPPPAVLLLADRSPSTEAVGPDGRTVLDAALARARRLLADAAAGAEVVERAFDPAHPAEVLDAMRAEGFERAVVATDGAIPAVPEFVRVGPEAPAGPNVALAGAALDADEIAVVVANHGPADVTATLRAGSAEVRVAVPARSLAEARLPAPAPGASARVALSPGGSLARDDTLEVSRLGGARSVRLEAARAAPEIERILRAVTGGSRGRGTAEVVVRYGGAVRADASRVLHLAPDDAAPDSPIALEEGGAPESVPGADVTGTGPLAAALPQPATTLAVTRRPVGGETFLRDSRGTLGAAVPGLVVLAVEPGSGPASAAGDPWLVVLCAAAIDRLAGGPDRVESSPLTPEESDVPSAAPPAPDAAALRACVRSSRPSGDPAGGPATALAAFGALCAAGAAWAGRRR
jgi:hypothetical protein